MYFANIALPLDLVRNENDVTLRLDVPGIDPKDPESIEVTVDRGILSVTVKRHEERTGTDSSSSGSAGWVPLPVACGCRRT